MIDLTSQNLVWLALTAEAARDKNASPSARDENSWTGPHAILTSMGAARRLKGRSCRQSGNRHIRSVSPPKLREARVRGRNIRPKYCRTSPVSLTNIYRGVAAHDLTEPNRGKALLTTFAAPAEDAIEKQP